MVAPSAPRDARSKTPPGPEGSNGIDRRGRRGKPAGPPPFRGPGKLRNGPWHRARWRASWPPRPRDRTGARASVLHHPALPVGVELQPRAAFEHEGVVGDAAVVGAGTRIQCLHAAVDAMALAVDRGVLERPRMRLPSAAPGHALAAVAGATPAQRRRECGAIPLLPDPVADAHALRRLAFDHAFEHLR